MLKHTYFRRYCGMHRFQCLWPFLSYSIYPAAQRDLSSRDTNPDVWSSADGCRQHTLPKQHGSHFLLPCIMQAGYAPTSICQLLSHRLLHLQNTAAIPAWGALATSQGKCAVQLGIVLSWHEVPHLEVSREQIAPAWATLLIESIVTS